MPDSKSSFLLSALTLLAFAPLPVAAEDLMAKADQIKAAYLFNFAKFIEWPEAAASTQPDSITVCTSTTSTLDSALRQIENRQANERTVRVHRNVGPDDLKSCHILYLDRESPLPVTHQQARDANVLTVGEGSSFISDGGIIAFTVDSEQSRFVEQARVRFEINQAAANRAGLVVSARLFQVAAKVHKQ